MACQHMHGGLPYPYTRHCKAYGSSPSVCLISSMASLGSQVLSISSGGLGNMYQLIFMKCIGLAMTWMKEVEAVIF